MENKEELYSEILKRVQRNYVHMAEIERITKELGSDCAVILKDYLEMYYPNSLLFTLFLVFLIIRILPRKPGIKCPEPISATRICPPESSERTPSTV